MNIGIEAKWYFEGPPSGKRVIRGLVDAILKIDTKNHYFIFLNEKQQAESFLYSGQKNVTVIYVWAGNNALSNIFLLPFYSRKYKIDVMLYQTFSSPFDRAKTIAYIHDVLFLSNPEYYTLYEKIYFLPLRFLTRKATAIITVSEEEKRRLIKFRYSDSAAKITVAYHGVDSTFSPRETYAAANIQLTKQKYNLPDRFLLFVGRLNLRKNVDNLLKAIPLVTDKTIPLVIVGADEWKKSNHLSIIELLRIENRIHFTGPIYHELGIVYSLATVFCFPSYAESFGLPPLEAMASGVPIVVSNTTSLPEICGPAGSYVDPNDPQQIATAIDNLLTNPQLYSEKKKLGLERAAKFTWEEAARITIACMESC